MWAWFVIRCVFAGLSRNPLAWLVALLLAMAWVTFEHLLPLGLTTSALHRSSAHYEIAFMGGAAGAGLAARALTRLEPALRPAPPLRRAGLEVAVMAFAAALLGSFAVVPSILFDAWQFARFDAAASSLALLVGWAHVAAVVAVVLRARSHEPAPLILGALFLTLGAPGLLPGDDWLQRGLLSILDAGALLRTSFDSPLNGAQLGWSLLPVAGWTAVRAATLAPDPR